MQKGIVEDPSGTEMFAPLLFIQYNATMYMHLCVCVFSHEHLEICSFLTLLVTSGDDPLCLSTLNST